MPRVSRTVYAQNLSTPEWLRAEPLDGAWRDCGNGLWLLTLPLACPGGARRLIPSLSVPTGEAHGFRFALLAGQRVIMLDSVGDEEIGDADVGLALNVEAARLETEPEMDYFPHPPAGDARLAVFLKAGVGVAADIPLLLALTDIDETAAVATPRAGLSAALPFAVPAISQFALDPVIGRRICSPTSAAMAASALLGTPHTAPRMAERAYAPARDAYGLWPRAIFAAAREGVAGLVTAVEDWDEAASLLDAGVPIAASITYKEGELPGADVTMTAGHFALVTGLSGAGVDVNDPAAQDDGAVPRRYDAAAFTQVWFGRKFGICYLFFKRG